MAMQELQADQAQEFPRTGTSSSSTAPTPCTGSTKTPDKALAKKRRDLYAAEVLRLANKPAGGAEPEDVQVASVLAVYMQDHGDDVASRATSAMAFRHLARYFDGKSVSDLNLSAFKEHARQQTEAGWAPATLNRVLVVLKAALRHGVKNGDLRSAPHVPTAFRKGRQDTLVDP